MSFMSETPENPLLELWDFAEAAVGLGQELYEDWQERRHAGGFAGVQMHHHVDHTLPAGIAYEAGGARYDGEKV